MMKKINFFPRESHDMMQPPPKKLNVSWKENLGSQVTSSNYTTHASIGMLLTLIHDGPSITLQDHDS